MKEVAAKAGVSTATVARYIHQNGYISVDAEKRVKAAIAETGYQLNIIAQSLRQQRTHTIAHILESATPNPFFMHVSVGAKAMADENDYHILEYNVQHNPVLERKAVEMFISRRVDAIMFTTPIDENNVALAKSSNIPVVQIEKPFTNNTDAILVDNYTGARAAIQHLIDLGHQRIAYIGIEPNPTDNKTQYSDLERFAGYRETLADSGYFIDDKFMAFGDGYSFTEMLSVGSGFELADRLLSLESPPTAIFAAGDNFAAGVMQAIYKHGLRVPYDISVIGFDDTYSAYLAPPLTTVKMPMQAMGREGVRLAIEQIEHQHNGHGTRSPQTCKLKTELIIRESTAPPSN